MDKNEPHDTKPPPPTSAPPSGAFTLATEYLAAILLFTLAGRWLDARLGTDMLFTLCGLLAGFAFGLYFTWKLVRSINASGTSADTSHTTPPPTPAPPGEAPADDKHT
jgi:F0F1-type ATP synthase assembly protein I